MGLSASQARLLSITARLSDNELHSQQIANAKIRLADQTQDASNEYIHSLNAKRLMFMTYDANGSAKQTELTPAFIYTYADMKNQYGIVNTSNQLLVSSTDYKNFQASATVSDFVQCYGCELTDNPKYLTALSSIYGQNYADFYDVADNAPKYNFSHFLNGVPSWIDGWNPDMANYDGWKNQFDSWQAPDKPQGAEALYGSLIQKLGDYPPELKTPERLPYPTKPEMGNISILAAAYNDSVCHSAVSGSTDGIGHMEHNLAALIWMTGGIGADSKQLTNSNGTIKIVNTESNCNTMNGFSLTNYDFSDYGGAATPLLEFINANKDQQGIKDLISSLTDLYCDVINYLHVNGQGSSTTNIDSSAYTITTTVSPKSATELMQDWNNFYNSLANISDYSEMEEYNKKLEKWQEECNKIDEQYTKEMADYDEQLAEARKWQESAKGLYSDYMDALANLPTPKTVGDDSKSQWYVNLWHRMNGESEYKDEANDGKYYKQLDDNLLTSESWLQFALEHAIVTMEQVQYEAMPEDITGLDHTKWARKIYTTCPDIVSVDDEVAIAKAEAEYKKKLNEIEAKDKRYDTDLKKLDTEHNALQTEYDSVKEVISKNVERSFKAFS